ncbi:MAG: TetR/AcrR family transcriptional regulator [Pseudomonadales bacterium]|nr:TetR/AcrR family transcriptional regulator [Pseudomonadales bacterium]
MSRVQKTDKKQRRRPKQQRSIARYNAVLDAAARVLMRQGYRKLTMSEICLESGQAYATVYQYFGNTDDVLAGWVNRLMDQFFLSLSVKVRANSRQSQAFYVDVLIHDTLHHIEEHALVLYFLFDGIPQLLTSNLVQTMEEKTLWWIYAEFYPEPAANQAAGYSPLIMTVKVIIGYWLQRILTYRKGESRNAALAQEIEELATLVKRYLCLE